MLGAPGSGKGTQATYIAEYCSIPTISTGSILREAMKAGTPIGQQARQFIEAGKLVPDAFVLGIIQERLKEADCANGFILDGFPRTLPQAEQLERITPIDYAVYLNIPFETIEKRMNGRRVCNNCGKTYNVQSLPPKQEGVCDACGSELIIRGDDNPETVKARLAVYQKESEPLVAFYKGRGKLLEVGETDSVEKMTEQIFLALGLNP